jgi:hypothetical protein
MPAADIAAAMPKQKVYAFILLSRLNRLPVHVVDRVIGERGRKPKIHRCLTSKTAPIPVMKPLSQMIIIL